MNRCYFKQDTSLLFKLLGLSVLILFVCFINIPLQAKIGCMDNSWHLAKPFDNKEYHYVSCNCPCQEIIQDRGRCLYCRHFHKPGKWTVIHYQKNRTYTNLNDAPFFYTLYTQEIARKAIELKKSKKASDELE